MPPHLVDTPHPCPQLFCFPFAGASYYAYAPLVRELSGQFEVTALDLPGHGKRIREPLLTDVRAMAQDLFPRVVKRINGPYGFFGHSLGALVAFEVARLIHGLKDPARQDASGQAPVQQICGTGIAPPVHLFISGRKGPLTASPETSVMGLSRQALLKKVADYGGTPALLLEQEEFMDFMAPILRADFEAVARYQYQPETRMDQPLTVMAGTREGISPKEAAQWQQVTRSTIHTQWFDGGHFFLFDHLPGIARLIAGQMGTAPPSHLRHSPCPDRAGSIPVQD